VVAPIRATEPTTRPDPGPDPVVPPARRREGLREAAVQVAAFALALLALTVVLALLGYPPGGILRALVDGSVGSKAALGVSLSEAMPLVLTGTAVWLALQVGLFNIGVDGQLWVGGTACLAAVLALPGGTPGPVLMIVGVVCGAAGGAAWAGIAAAMRVARGANEVISTVMLNFVAFIVVDELMTGWLRAPEADHTPRTSPIPEAAHLPQIVPDTRITIGILLAAAISIVCVRLVRGSWLGLRLRSIGLNEEAAAHAGLPVDRYRLLTFGLSGAVAGIAGALVILGLRFAIAPGWASSWGLLGILVAFLAIANPYMIVTWGVLFGMLAAAGPELKGATSVPDAVVVLMQVLPVVALFALRGAVRVWRRHGAGGLA
jgi:ABC-type uncharacterized transport system permease subunit